MLHKNAALPLNGFSQEKVLENGSRTEGPDEDWPDWEEVGEKSGKYQPVQISLELADCDSQLPTTAAYDEEEPWDNFEDSEVIYKDSTTEPQPAPASNSLSNSAIGSSTVSTSTSEPAKESKALKLSTASAATASEQEPVSSEQNINNTRSTKPSVATIAKPKNGAGAGGLGEEFTIEVKKKPERDPELDLFADMVPDIKLSSPSIFFGLESSVSKPDGHPAATVFHTEPDTTHLNTLELTAKFAAVDLTEVSEACFIPIHSLV